MSFSVDDVYFFQQRRRPRIERRRKRPHELPQFLRYFSFNSKATGAPPSKEKEEETGRSQEDSSRTLGSKSSGGSQPVVELVVPAKPAPQPEAVSRPNQQHTATLATPPEADEWDLQRVTYEELRRSSPNILERLSQLLYSRNRSQANIPRFLAYQLESNWRELTSDAYLEPREWQTAGCREVARQRQVEEEKRRRDQASNASGESSHLGETAEVGAPEQRKTKKKNNGEVEGEAATSEVVSVSGKKELTPPGGPASTQRRGSRSSAISTSRPAPSSRAPPASARSNATPSHRLSVSHRASAMLRIPGTQRSVVSGTQRSIASGCMDDFVSERTSLGGVSKMCNEKESSSEQLPLSALAHDHSRGYGQTTIQFLLSSKECDERGWIKHEDGLSPVELLLQWARIRLGTAIKAKKESDRIDQERNFLEPTSVLLYGQPAANTGLLTSRRRPHTTQNTSQPVLPCLLTSTSISNFNQASYAAYLAPIPPVLPWQTNTNRKVWKTVSNNGTTSIFYPNGSLAIIRSHAGPSKKGFFLHAYDTSPVGNSKDSGRTLVTFTPYGRGTCYHSNGMLRFVAFEKGVSLHDDHGTRLRKYRWPAPTSKLPASVILRLNDHLTFRCLSRSEMSLEFAAEGSCITFNLGVDHEAIENHAKEVEDVNFLVSGISFTSHTAKELVKPSGKRQKQRRPQKKVTKPSVREGSMRNIRAFLARIPEV